MMPIICGRYTTNHSEEGTCSPLSHPDTKDFFGFPRDATSMIPRQFDQIVLRVALAV